MQNPYTPPPYTSPPSPPRSGLSGWVWALIACGGCGCVGFVIIFAAILFPVFAQARLKARQVSCMSNVKQINLALLMYAEDYDEVLPASNAWVESAQPYLVGNQKGNAGQNLPILHCPSVPAGDYGYAYNSQLSRKALKKISTPKTTIMLYDSSNLARDASDPVTSLPDPPRHIGNSISFVDGHVRSLRNRQEGAATPNGNE